MTRAPARRPGSLRALFLAANPSASRLGLDTEMAEIRDVIRLGSQRDGLDIHSRSDVRWRDLRQAILDVQPDILHFSGHGSKSGLVLTDDERLATVETSTRALNSLCVALPTIRLLVLNACHTATDADLLAETVDHVIGMSGAIDDDAASAFSQGFYSALASGHTVEVCYRVGIAEIEGRRGDPTAAHTPVHRSRPGRPPGLWLGAHTPGGDDPLLTVLLRVSTGRNVFRDLPRELADDLTDAFPSIADVVRILGQAETLIHEAGDQIPELFRGKRLRVGQVPLGGGTLHAWHSAVRDAAAISPYALLAILLIASSETGVVQSLPRAIAAVNAA